MVTKLNSIVFGFVKAQLLVSLIILAVTFVGLLFIKPQYAIVMSIRHLDYRYYSNFRFNYYSRPMGIVLLCQWRHFDRYTINILAIILLVIRRTVEPKIMGTQIGLKPLPTLIAMFIGLKLFGFSDFFLDPLS